jgi:hypothetical protein
MADFCDFGGLVSNRERPRIRASTVTPMMSAAVSGGYLFQERPETQPNQQQ